MAWRRSVELCSSTLETVLTFSSRRFSSTTIFPVQTLSSSRHALNSNQYNASQWKRQLHDARGYSSKAKGHGVKKYRDLYAILGVSPHATQAQVKDAYYRLSMQYHPDRNKGSEVAHQKFTELTEAYSVLGQYDLRRKYDKGLLHQYPRQPSHTHSEHTSHHTAAHSGQSTVRGKKSRFDFDEFYRAHYGEALRKEQEARKSRAAARERAKLYSVSNSWQQMLIIGVTISVLFVGWYGYNWQRQPNRTTAAGHEEA